MTVLAIHIWKRNEMEVYCLQDHEQKKWAHSTIAYAKLLQLQHIKNSAIVHVNGYVFANKR